MKQEETYDQFLERIKSGDCSALKRPKYGWFVKAYKEVNFDTLTPDIRWAMIHNLDYFKDRI